MSKKQTPRAAWPDKEHRTGSDAQLHAMGQVSLIYNELEQWLSFLFEQLFPASLSASTSLYNRLNNRDRIDLLTATVEANEEDEILIPRPIDQNWCAHWRNPMDMMRQG